MKNTLNNTILNESYKKISLNTRISDINKTKYLPSFTSEWKDTIYSYNKNTVKNIPSHHHNVNKIIQSYFNLYFKSSNLNTKNNFISSRKHIAMKRRRNLLRKIYVSNPDIKYTNNKATITLFTLNRERNLLYKKYINSTKKLQAFLINRYLHLYKSNIMNLYDVLSINKNMSYFLLRNKNKFLEYKLKYFNKFLLLKNLYLKKVWANIIKTSIKAQTKHLQYLRKYELEYSLNKLKFNKLTLLNKLSLLLNKILGKKIEYKIINLKSIVFNTDLFTQALALKFKKKKSFNYKKSILSILHRAKFGSLVNPDIKSIDKFKEYKILSYIGEAKNLDQLINSFNPSSNHQTWKSDDIHKEIFNSIKYKNLNGIRIETKGRLTKRYRADRAVHYKKYKGGLQNTSLNTTLFRGNINPNVSYSIVNNTRRVGSFAIKGWISGK